MPTRAKPADPRALRVGLYQRVSTEEQVEGGIDRCGGAIDRRR